MKTRRTTLGVVIGLGLSFATSIPALAVGIGGGMTNGPDDSFNINLNIFNDARSTSDLAGITIDGSTAKAFPLVWDSVLDVSPPPGASVSTLGEDTQLLSFNFTPAPDGFNPGESLSFSVDPDTIDDPSAGITIRQLIGVQVMFNFTDSSSSLGTFVDNPAPGAGLVVVPEPSSVLGTLAFGAFGAGWMLKRRQK